MKSQIFKNKAFSLIELMVAVVILGIISASVATGFTSLFQRKVQIVTESEIHNIQNAISSYLRNNASCSAELSGKTLPRRTWTDLKLTRYKGFGDWAGILKSNSNLGKMKIKTLSIRRKPGSLEDRFKDGITNYKIYIAQIKIQFAMSNLESKIFSPFYIELPIFAKSPYTKIESCYSGTKLPYFCQTLGLAYDSYRNMCKPQHQCFLRGFYSREYCPGRIKGYCRQSGSDKRNPITNWYSCPSGASNIKVGLYSNNYREGCGKKCTRVVQRRIESYICMQCN
ncbi:MAG: type II secretion system protein [Bdellovibrionales bacterium]|nr:type II secretion system protein [Bdellovibrionales bacterium]